jgi:hypothetical protein
VIKFVELTRSSYTTIDFRVDNLAEGRDSLYILRRPTLRYIYASARYVYFNYIVGMGGTDGTTVQLVEVQELVTFSNSYSTRYFEPSNSLLRSRYSIRYCSLHADVRLSKLVAGSRPANEYTRYSGTSRYSASVGFWNVRYLIPI